MRKKSLRILGIILVIYAALVATHEGEFWPFSIYPMFSQAGNPWTRALAKEMTGEQNISWETAPISKLPGKTFAFDEVGINTNDVANYLQKAGSWDSGKIRGIRALFSGELQKRDIMLYKVQGRLTEADSVIVEATPFLYLKSDTTLFNPKLKFD